MRTFDFYEFVGIIIPGSALLMSAGFMLRVDYAGFLLIPNSFGAFGGHLLIAYMTGHLVQAIGNYVESAYWRVWKGMPTDWPISRKEADRFPGASASVLRLTRSSDLEDIERWRILIRQVRSIVYSEGRANRLQYFNGTYGMFRGIVAVGLVTACFAWASPMNSAWLYSAIALVIGISLNRMHRFAIHYANELFANVSALALREDGESDGQSRTNNA